MPKLKQKDKRATDEYDVGDIVRLHGKHVGKNHKAGGPGIVLDIVSHNKTPDGVVDQTLNIMFANTEEELFTSCRQYARKRVKQPSYSPSNSQLWNNSDVLYENEPQLHWLDAPSKDELDMERFMDLFDDLP